MVVSGWVTSIIVTSWCTTSIFWKLWEGMLFSFQWHRERSFGLVLGPGFSSISPHSRIKLINSRILKPEKEYFELRHWFVIFANYAITEP